MSRQNMTGKITEKWVKNKIIELGFRAYEPMPDRGVDFVVISPEIPDKECRLQVRGFMSSSQWYFHQA